MAMTAAYISLLVLVGIERLVEVGVSRRNQRRMFEQGVRKIPEPHFPWLILFHAIVLICAGLEVLFLHRPMIPALAISMFALFVLSNLLRWWVIRLLADLWNVQIMDSARVRIVTSGPYRWIRHPNYVGVMMEVFSLPMIHTAWITALVGTALYMDILRRRLRIEDSVLMADPAYRLAMGDKPRFFPRLFRRASSLPGREARRLN
jgi:methyltransferase